MCCLFCMETVLRILHLEDDARDAELIEIALRREGLHFEMIRARREDDFRKALENESLDLILSDFSIPGFDGTAALDFARRSRPDVPFIFLSGTIGEERAVLALRQGATDYVLKDRIGRLPAAIQRALSEAREIVRRRQAEEKARISAERFKHLLAHSPAVLYSMLVKGPEATPVFVSENVTSLLGFTVTECLEPQWWRGQVHPDDLQLALAHLPNLLAHGASAAEYRMRHRDGRYLWIQDDVRLVQGGPDEPTNAVGAWTDVTERKRIQAELIQASRLAGKEEIATGILHDVRNVLTSINISFSFLRSKIKEMSTDGVQKASSLINDQANLAVFLTEHQQGKKLPAYLTALAGKLTQQRQEINSELDRLAKSVEHVHHIISAQQVYAKVSGNREAVHLQAVLEESLSLNGMSTPVRGWTVVKKFAPITSILIEKHKLLQILVNLIRNAKQACESESKDQKTITLDLSSENDWISISVEDNGVGISPENLPRLFEHGFTTKKDGHGFGLRNAASAAKELGGSLRAESAGLHCGASFILKVPYLK
jgi:PAS domain S-box-containing protein